MRVLFFFLILCAATVGLFWAAQFGWGPVVITNEDQYTLVLRLGNPNRTKVDPGISFRIPVVETAEKFDKRLQFLDAKPVELLIGNETMVVDYYAVWQIKDPLLFARSFPRLMQGAEVVIQRRLQSLIGATIGRLPLHELLSRGRLVNDMSKDLEGLSEKGIEVVDIRINRTDLPKEAEAAAFDRMREQRRAISREHRARGEREAREIRAKAEREARTTLAEAQSNAEVTRGLGDAEAADIYARAYGKDPEFYSFLRSLEAYRNSLKVGTTLVLSPRHEFFRYLEPGEVGEAEHRAVKELPAAEKAQPAELKRPTGS